MPKKSLSMGAIKAQAQSQAIPTVHKKRKTYEKEGATNRRFYFFFFSFEFQFLFFSFLYQF